jgi:hypothetical protein
VGTLKSIEKQTWISGDHLAMIPHKGEPLFDRVSPRRTLRRKYLATVRSATVKPSFCDSA